MKSKILLILILLFAAFLRFYKVPELMNFGGDVARDYLTAGDITVNGIVPLVGCPSSVPWLHQGAFFIYLLGIVLWLGKYNPLIGGYFVGMLGVLGVFSVYLLGKKLFSKEAGLWAAFFYASSSYAVIFDRYPYHQSPVSLLTILFFLSLYSGMKGKERNYILASLLFGVLMQFELSNLVLLPVLITVFALCKKQIGDRTLVLSFGAFFLPWLPKIIYDFSHGWLQTLGFGAWFVHKILPVNIPGDTTAETLPFFDRFGAIFQYISKMIFWPNILFSAIIFISLVLFFLIKSFAVKENLKDILKGNIKKAGEFLIFLWLLFSFLGFILHGSPSAGYVPVLFALPALLLGFLIWQTKNKILKTVFCSGAVFLIGFNGFFLLKTDFLTLTDKMKPEMARIYPQSYKLFSEMAEYIVSDSAGKPYSLMSMGEFADFPSNIDTFRYLTWYFGNPESEKKEESRYLIYYNFDEKRYNSLRGEKKIFPFMTIVRN